MEAIFFFFVLYKEQRVFYIIGIEYSKAHMGRLDLLRL